MKRFHVHVSVDDLAQSIRFYSTLFAAEPTVVKPDYAKWMLEDPRVNFAISTGSGAAGISHLGIQAEDSGELGRAVGNLLHPWRGHGLRRKRRADKARRSQRRAVDLRLRAGRPHRNHRDDRLLRRLTMADKAYNVLFLCTGNSARSILAEVLIEHWGRGRFTGYSAGSFPRGTVHPLALDLLERLHLRTEGLRSKSWDEFARPGAPAMDFVFTVCDQAAGEVCPIWPGNPVTAHWGTPDPAAVEGADDRRRQAFRDAHRQLEMRIKLFVALPIDKLDRLAIKREVDDIGHVGVPERSR
jgi:arsenate reductase (thioredoxin)